MFPIHLANFCRFTSTILPASLAALLFLRVGDVPLRAADAPATAEPSSVADFELKDLEGKEHKLSDYSAKKAVVVAFITVGCPLSKLYASRLAKLDEQFREDGVQLLAISSNRSDEVTELRAFAHEFAIQFPILKDHDGKIASSESFGVRRVPEVFVLDAARSLKYRGRIDDQHTLSERSVGVTKRRAEHNYLEDALGAILAGKDVEVRSTETVGCLLAPAGKDAAPSKVTFHEDVEPILQRKCQNCHRPGQIAPFSLLSYDDASGWEGMIAEVVENGRMPPWQAHAGAGQFSNDRSLSAAEKETILQWARGGAPRGDPSRAPPPVKFADADWLIGKPDAVFEIPRPFDVPARGSVKYQYFMVPTGFTEDKWVQAVEVRAGNRSVVHHILVFYGDPKDPRRWEREFGGGTQGYFAAMVPGELPVVYPEGTGKRIPAGSNLIFQIHYTTNGVAGTDRSRIGLIFAKSEVKQEVKTRAAVNTKFRIPANTERHVATASQYFPRTMTLLSFLPHMHLRGAAFRYDLLLPTRVQVSKSPYEGLLPEEVLTRMRYDARDGSLTWVGAMNDKAFEELSAYYGEPQNREALEKIRKDGREEVLLDVPGYDFGWQSSYILARPIIVPEGSRIECTAAFNNSASNPALTRDMWEKSVRWGEQTWEEMLIGYFDSIDGEVAGARGAGGDRGTD